MVYGETNTSPEIIIQKVTRSEVPETVSDKQITEKAPVVEYIEVEKEVPVELKQFESEEALIEWLDIDRTNDLPYIKDVFECEHFAQTLMKNTLRGGHHMSFQVLKNYRRPDTKEFIEGPHVINSTIIGNYIYFIDPQTDELWIAYLLEK